VSRDGSGKVFCIGLPKTGTSSFRVACEMIGLRVMGDPLGSDLTSALAADGRIPDARYDAFDVFADVSISAYWPELYAAYPRARWVLTTRPPFEWAESVRAVFGARRIRPFPVARLDRAAGVVADWMMREQPPEILRPWLAIQHQHEVQAQLAMPAAEIDLRSAARWPNFAWGVVEWAAGATTRIAQGAHQRELRGITDPWPHANPRSEQAI